MTGTFEIGDMWWTKLEECKTTEEIKNALNEFNKQSYSPTPANPCYDVIRGLFAFISKQSRDIHTLEAENAKLKKKLEKENYCKRDVEDLVVELESSRWWLAERLSSQINTLEEPYKDFYYVGYNNDLKIACNYKTREEAIQSWIKWSEEK